MGLRLTCLAVLVLGVGALTSGCLSSSSPPGEGPEDAGGISFDSSISFDAPASDTYVPSTPDATPDGSVPDAATPDTSTADAAPLPVTLVVVDTSGGPESGVTVVFSDATGAVLTTDTTGATGTVSEVVPAGSQVTVLFGNPTASESLVTIVGVEPGDKLTAIDPQAEANFDEEVSVTALPSLALADGGTDGGTFTVNAGSCYTGFATTFPLSFNVYGQCEIGGKFPLLATANDVNDNPFLFAFQNGNAVAPDGGLDDAGAQAITMAADPWLPLGSVTLSATNAPSGLYVSFDLNEVSGDVSYRSFQGEGQGESAIDGGAQTTLPVHPGYADFTQTEVYFQAPNNGSGGGDGQPWQFIATRSASLPASPPPFDLSTALPPLTNALLDYSNGARPTVSWSSAAPLTSIDGTIVVISWYVPGPSEGYQGSWTFIVPPAATTVQAPALPAALAAWAPSAGFSLPIVVAADATFLPNYAAFRAVSANLATVAQSSECFNWNPPTTCIPPLPEDGTLQMTTYLGGGT